MNELSVLLDGIPPDDRLWHLLSANYDHDFFKTFEAYEKVATPDECKKQFEMEVIGEITADYLDTRPEQCLMDMEAKYGHLKYRTLLGYLVDLCYRDSDCEDCGKQCWECECLLVDDTNPNWQSEGF
jgi:hypothetical protein